MRERREKRTSFSSVVLTAGVMVLSFLTVATSLTFGQSSRNLTPVQIEIEKQQERLTSGSEEERRDALMRLGAMHLPAASRTALSGISDPSPMIRAVAA